MVGHRIAYNLGTLLSMNDVLLCSKLADKKCNVDSLWIPESWGREAFTSLGALSQNTEQVKLGTSIISIYARTPATVAMAATTLDFLSNNRSIIGLGASHIYYSRKLAWPEIPTAPCENARILGMFKTYDKSTGSKLQRQIFQCKEFQVTLQTTKTKHTHFRGSS